MKKIKVFLTLILSLSCLFSLFGCSGRDGRYVQNSLEYDVTYLSYSEKASVTAEFQVYLPDAELYEVSYTLELYYADEFVDKERFSITRRSTGGQTVDIYKYWSVEFSGYNVSEYKFEVRLSGISVKKKSSTSYYDGLAIGFGVVGGLILVGIAALYIYLNKRGDKAQAA